jgi:hypothetical protein
MLQGGIHTTCVQDHPAIINSNEMTFKALHPARLACNASSILLEWCRANEAKFAHVCTEVICCYAVKMLCAPAQAVLSALQGQFCCSELEASASLATQVAQITGEHLMRQACVW